jgi:O-antigen/teichoic acid export membrane protein
MSAGHFAFVKELSWGNPVGRFKGEMRNFFSARRRNHLLPRLKASAIVRDTSHLAIGQGLRLVTQAAYFVLIARSLGPEKYGTFVAIVALAAVLSPFSGLGTNNLFVKNVRSGKRTPGVCWGNGLMATMVSGTVFSGVVFAINYLFHLRMSFWVVAAVCISDLLLLRVIELASFGFGAIDRMKENAIQNATGSLPRLVAIGMLSLWWHPVTLQRWAGAYLLASATSTLYALYRAHSLWGAPKFNWRLLREDVGEGVYFSIGTSAATVYNDIDKVMLGRVSFGAAGIYAAAYRIIDVSMTPIRSLASAAYPHFFRKGNDGMACAHGYATTQIKRACVYSTGLLAVLWFSAPLLPLVLGANYAQTAVALRWLALIPVLRSIHIFLADSLSGAGFQSLRSVIQVLIAIINITLNLAILPRYGWLGAAWTSLASDALLLLSLWIAIQYKLRAPSRRRPKPAAYEFVESEAHDIS